MPADARLVPGRCENGGFGAGTPRRRPVFDDRELRCFMNRKRILRWVAAVCLLVLAVCTGVSYFVYDALLPRIEVYNFIARDSPNPNDYEIEWWVPESCIQSRDEHDQVTIYRVLSRDGIFGVENFVEAIDGKILRQGEGEVELDAPAMYIEEKLVLTTDKPLRSGTVVSILNPEVWQE